MTLPRGLLCQSATPACILFGPLIFVPMRPVLEHFLAGMLHQAGFKAFNRQALALLAAVFEDRLAVLLMCLNSRAIHAGRPGATLTDLLGAVYGGLSLNSLRTGGARGARVRLARPTEAAAARAAAFALPATRVTYPMEAFDLPEEWESPISTRVEKFIHIYDFMPPFPPIHTFRMTPSKTTENISFSARVKNRLEQSLKSENNMIRLIKSSGTLPAFVHFIHNERKKT